MKMIKKCNYREQWKSNNTTILAGKIHLLFEKF